LTTALIDGDWFAFCVAAASETVIELPDGKSLFEADLDEAKSALDDKIGDAADRIGATRQRIALSPPRNFRYDVLPTYKHTRRDVRKPVLLRPLKDYLVEKHGAVIKPNIEADDVLGIWATWPKLKGKKIIVSVDKDLKQIPGWFFSPMHSDPPLRISEHDADWWHFMQTLTGDAVDGYKGCPGIGPKKAEAILFGISPPWGHTSEVWPAIVAAFASKNLTEADALVQARVARICRASDYNFETQEPILWSPPQG
jgi:DNA polymerase-1